MHINDGDLILTGQELCAALKGLGLTISNLAALPEVSFTSDQSSEAAKYLDELSVSQRSLFTSAFNVLAKPAKTVRLHYSIADESVSRYVLGWGSALSEGVAVLVKSGDTYRVGVRTEPDLTYMMGQVLAINDNLHSDNFGVSSSTEAILVFMAVTDTLRYARHYSCLIHTEPVTSFTPSEVKDRLEDAGKEDFRWPLLFVDKILPIPVAQMGLIVNLEPSLQELEEKGLITSLDDVGGQQLYALTKEGEIIADALLHEVSKATIGISALREDSTLGHEVMLLVRSSLSLFLFDISGKEGVVAMLSGSDLAELVKSMLGRNVTSSEQEKPESPTPELAQPAEQAPTTQTPATSAAYCPKCGQKVNPVDNFCINCGIKL